MPDTYFRSVTSPCRDPAARHAMATVEVHDSVRSTPGVSWADVDAEVMVRLFSRCAEDVGSASGEPTGYWRLVRERNPDHQSTRFRLRVEFLPST